MRRALFLAPLLLASCIPRPQEAPPPRPRPAAQAQPPLQCYAGLRAAGASFRPLPDSGTPDGCGMTGAVQLLDIGTPVRGLGAMTCGLAERFTLWVRDAVQPAARGAFGVAVARIDSFGTYSCRPLNNQAGARLSEHGRANAVDIGAFVLRDGRRISVAADWNGGDATVRRFLRAVHDEGCRRFNVVLGPDANAFHRDHLHFDMGRGPYCR
ncbi:MAG: extensin family protein [Alphaproteobacteria bacterium]|nr:extensin family protein [Alphaproteobacteria bacterium]